MFSAWLLGLHARKRIKYAKNCVSLRQKYYFYEHHFVSGSNMCFRLGENSIFIKPVTTNEGNKGQKRCRKTNYKNDFLLCIFKNNIWAGYLRITSYSKTYYSWPGIIPVGTTRKSERACVLIH